MINLFFLAFLTLGAFAFSTLSAQSIGNNDLIKARVTVDFKEYAAIRYKATHEEAKQICQELAGEDFPGGTLATFELKEELDTLWFTLVPQLNNGRDFWIDYKKVESDSSFNDPLSYGFTGYGKSSSDDCWDTNEPSARGADSENRNCILSTDDLLCGPFCFEINVLISESCEQKHNFVCQRSIEVVDDDDLVIQKRVKLDNKEYILLSNQRNYPGAEEACKSLGSQGFPAGRMIQFHSEEELRFLEDKFARQTFWYGFKKLSPDTPFVPSSYGMASYCFDSIEEYCWDGDEPSDSGAVNNINCVYSTYNSFFDYNSVATTSCTTNLMKPACERYLTPDEGFLAIEARDSINGKEFAALNQRLTYSEAEEVCQNLEEEGFSNGVISRPKNFEELQFITETLIPNLEGHQFWSGYVKLDSSNSFLPSNYGILDETPDASEICLRSWWDYNEPSSRGANADNVNCIHADSGTRFASADGVSIRFGPLRSISCEVRFNFVCERSISITARDVLITENGFTEPILYFSAIIGLVSLVALSVLGVTKLFKRKTEESTVAQVQEATL